MKILGIDTSSKFLSIALCEGQKLLIEESHLLERRHSALLIPKIKEMLEKSDLSIDEVDAFVVGLGPGSFTGLRIGVSAVKGFGIATKKPCIGVSSLDALASAVEKERSLIVPVIDAKRGNVYSAIYERKNGKIARKTPHLLLSINELMRKIKGPALFFGDGVELYRKEIAYLNKKVEFLDEEYWYPKAGNIIKLAMSKIRKQKEGSMGKLKPIYLYPRDCQVKKS